MIKQRLTIAQIRSSLPREKEELTKTNPWSYYVLRPTSFYPTWLFLRLGISANATTLIYMITGIIGFAFLAYGSYWAIITGAVLVNIAAVFDDADGNIARCTNTCTTYGEFIDEMGMYASAALMPIAIGVGLYFRPDPYLNHLSNLFFGTGISNIIYLLLGLLYALFRIFRFLIADKFGLTFSMTPRDLYKPEAGSKRSPWGIIYKSGVTLLILVRPILLVAAIANVLSIFIAVYTLLSTVELIAVAMLTLVRARKIEETVK